MRISIINSKIDAAGLNIRRHLLEKLKSDKTEIQYFSHTLHFYETEGRLINENSLDHKVKSDLIIFISRHTSKNPVPVLTVHVTGNYGKAMLGGEDKTLAAASPKFMHATLNEMEKRAPKGYGVSYEVTHHGPTDLKTPSFFVEIGSTEEEWNDDNAGTAVACSLLEILKQDSYETINLVGFGGNHYAARETEIAKSSGGAFGHIAHTREAETLTNDIVARMIQKSRADAAYIDKKALKKSDVRKIEDILSEAEIPVLSEGEIKAISDIPWDDYIRIRNTALGIDPGCKIHVGGLKGTGHPAIVEIPADLFSEAYKADDKLLFEGLLGLNVVHLTSKTGRMLPIFITYEEKKVQTVNDLISLCVKILHKETFTVVNDDSLIIRKVRFDPEMAAKLGVPKGPLFGRLAAGFDVVVDGRQVTPAMVSKSSETVVRIPELEKYL